MYFYYYNKLHLIDIDFDEPYFRAVINAFIEKYGTGELKTEMV
jgi:tRNA U34 2-thiouridine synthase MnmA/TrmU